MRLGKCVVLIILVTSLSSCYSSQSNRVGRLLDLDEKVTLPLLGSSFGGLTIEQVLNLEPLNVAPLHPLRLAVIVLNLMKIDIEDGDALYDEQIKNYLDFLLLEYPNRLESESAVIYQYPFSWNELEPGWWSGMANASVSMVFLEGWRRFHDPRYLKQYRKALNGVVNVITDNGSAIMLDADRCWFSEYAFDELDPDKEYYVLNGFLVALLATKIASEHDPDELYANMYEDKYQCGLEALKLLCDQFYYSDDEWTYYMLNPPTNEPVHYAIYDMQLYEALWELTGDEFYKGHVERRRAILKKQYPIEICAHDNNKFIFSTIGPPYPYWIDTYSLKLRFYDAAGQLRNDFSIDNVRDKNISIGERSFLQKSVDYETIESYAISSTLNSGSEYLLYEGNIKDLPVVDCSAIAKRPGYTAYCAYDAFCDEGEKLENIIIDSSILSNTENVDSYVNSQGRVVLRFNDAIDRKKYKYFGFTAGSSRSIGQFRITIIDTEGNAASQYYVEPMEGQTNLIVASWLGFAGIDSILSSIAEVHITFFTSGWDGEESAVVDWNEFMLFDNNYQLYEYMIKHEDYYPEQ